MKRLQYIRGVSLIELIVYITITSFVLLTINQSIGYFKTKVEKRLQIINERVYVERAWYFIDTLTINATEINIATTTDGFVIELKALLVQGGSEKSFEINCSSPAGEINVSFKNINTTKQLISKPFAQIQECNIEDIGDEFGVSTNRNKIILKTALNTYTHQILNFSQK